MRALTVRPYDHSRDFAPVGRLLVESYEPGDRPRTWLQPRWEYALFHPLIVGQPIERFGVAEQDGRIVGILHFEDRPAIAYVQVRPGHASAIGPLLEWAERHLGGPSPRFGFADPRDHRERARSRPEGRAGQPRLRRASGDRRGLVRPRPRPAAARARRP